ncbi:MAG: hypothetical protein IJC34_08690 [Lentisphaeria bacterium]|nr:hypothetical protein [Lentisphaeria bacterium]MBQ7394329.1 hypothetical protein [Lentisphaeria bacterium]
MKRLCLLGLFLAASTVLSGAEAGAAGIRTIRLRQDDAQVRYASRVFELKHADAQEILPFVNSAIKRYSRNSSVRRVTTLDGKSGNALLVSTGRDFLPMVADIIATMDRPGLKGTGIAHVAYSPKYRAAMQFADIINKTSGSSAGAAYVNGETNTIFWRDQQTAAQRTLDFIGKLDRPIPQVNVRINYYELRDSDLKDWGFDYLAWKNGPGVNLLNLAYNAGGLSMDQTLNNIVYAASNVWSYGGFFTAPQIDMSFIRCLQQSGSAAIAAHAGLTMLNTPVKNNQEYFRIRMAQGKDITTAPYVYRVSMQPEYQNIAKNTLGRSFIGKSFYEDEDGNRHTNPPTLDATIMNPFVCLGENGKGNLLFQYALNFKSVVERGNTGSELSNSAVLSGAATLAFGVEKVLAVYEKENDVEQTIGLPILSRIPVIKYLFSTVTTIRERTYIVLTAEAAAVDANNARELNPVSMSSGVKRRIENPFRKNEE